MAGAVLLLLAMYVVFVTTSTGQVTEYLALEAATQRLPLLRDGVPLGILQRLPQIVGITGVLVFLLVTVWRRRWLASLIAAAAFAGANLSTQLLKDVILVRPDLDNGVPYYTGNSLPSGHATFAAAAAVAVLLVVAPRWRPVTAALGAVFSTAVGAATFVETWHRPADMAAAYLVTAFWALAGGLVVFRTGEDWNTRSRRTGRHPWPAGHPGWEVLLWVAGAAAVAGAWGCFAVAGGAGALTVDAAGDSGWHYAGGLLLATGPGLLVFAFLSTFFRWQSGRR